MTLTFAAFHPSHTLKNFSLVWLYVIQSKWASPQAREKNKQLVLTLDMSTIRSTQITLIIHIKHLVQMRKLLSKLVEGNLIVRDSFCWNLKLKNLNFQAWNCLSWGRGWFNPLNCVRWGQALPPVTGARVWFDSQTNVYHPSVSGW